MSHPKNPLRINVGFLIYQPVGTYRDFSFTFPSFIFPEEVEIFEFESHNRIHRTTGGLLVQSKTKGKVNANCVRCLEDFYQEINIDFEELYAFPDDDWHSKKEDDSELVLPENGYIDLNPLIREYMIISIPISPVCKKDCQGLCPVCGKNLNDGTCNHPQEPE